MLDSAWLFALPLALPDAVAAALAGELLAEPLVELLPELLQAAASKHAIGITAISTRRRVFIRLPLTWNSCTNVVAEAADATIALNPACPGRCMS
jgi:hypothetical protein